MDDTSLLGRIRKYARKVNSISRPTTQDEEELLNTIIDKKRFNNYTRLDLNELRKDLKVEKAEEIEDSLMYYKNLATELGVEIEDSYSVATNSTTSEDLSNSYSRANIESVHINYDAAHIKNESRTASTLNDTVNSATVTLTPNIDLSSSELIELNIVRGNISAYGSYNPVTNKIKVLRGSKLNNLSKNAGKQSKNLRKKYSAILVNNELLGDTDYLTPNESLALVFGYGCNINSKHTTWRDTSGRVFSEICHNSIDFSDDIDKVTEDDVESCENNSLSDYGEEVEDLTHEEMLTKGLLGVLTKDKSITIELGSNTIKMLGDKVTEIYNNNIKTYDVVQDEFSESLIIEDGTIPYTEEDRNNDVIGIPYSKVKRAVNLGMNVIYRGVPGCGKTYAANCDAKALLGLRETNRILQIDINENYNYSESMVGLKQTSRDKWDYKRGEIVRFCDFASKYPDKKFVLILNEITRGKTEAILGQMFTAMESRYRGKSFKLDNGDTFVCPKNIIILATMNGTDKGVKKLDIATEERFYIIDVKPLWAEWATNKSSFNRLIDALEIEVGSEEYSILEKLCSEMAIINSHIENAGILNVDNTIGQRQLLQFLANTDIDGNKIVFNKNTLAITLEQLIIRITPLVDSCVSIETNLRNIEKLLEKCNA